MNSIKLIPAACLAACARLKVAPTERMLSISIAGQTASLIQAGMLVDQMPCSTSRFGVGQVEGSNCTPLGLHRIAEKIGGGAPVGTVFKARQVVGHTSQREFAHATITTLIMWLEGMEPGFNHGANVDSHARYIYVHGTGDQDSIGRQASHGCVLLADADLVSLFDRLATGDLVWIAEK